MALCRRRRCLMSQSRKHWMEKWWIGWRKSRIRNTNKLLRKRNETHISGSTYMNWLDRALQISIVLFVAAALIPMASSNDTVAAGPRIEIETKDSMGATPGPAADFTGTVRIAS